MNLICLVNVSGVVGASPHGENNRVAYMKTSCSCPLHISQLDIMKESLFFSFAEVPEQKQEPPSF